MSSDITKRRAIRFVVLPGCISLFSHMTYEAARSISGPYLSILGVSGATVGWVAELIPAYKRGTAFGVFNAGFGIFWFLGSVALGYLYDFSIPWLVIFSMGMQLTAIVIFWMVVYHSNKNISFHG